MLTTTNFFTRWVETITLKIITSHQVISFIEHNIIIRLGLPKTWLFDNATYFYSPPLTIFAV